MRAVNEDSDLQSALSVQRPASDWRRGEANTPSCTQVQDDIVCEVPVALVYNGISHVVMMATPDHLADFALGFSLTEGIVQNLQQIYSMETVRQADAGIDGIEVRIDISTEQFAALKTVRRNLTGRTGCGLCGAESLQQAIRKPVPVTGEHPINHNAIENAVGQLADHQPLQAQTGAVHGAAWCDAAGNIQCLREDVGRHNALDKLIGQLSSAGKENVFNKGFALISSRASYEMVVKAAAMNIGILVAVSAPTSLAIELAEAANITLVGFARPGRHMVYSHPFRIVD